MRQEFLSSPSNLDRDIQTLERAAEALADRPDQQKESQASLARRREERLRLGKQLAAARERLKLSLQSEQVATRGQQEIETRKAQLADLEARRKALEENVLSLRGRYNSTHPQVVQVQSELDRLVVQLAAAREGRSSSGSGRRIIDTSFSMDVGETVVVGTSRLGGGDKAIIALLTAVARSGR